jgi:hypothetical protein
MLGQVQLLKVLMGLLIMMLVGEFFGGVTFKLQEEHIIPQQQR